MSPSTTICTEHFSVGELEGRPKKTTASSAAVTTAHVASSSSIVTAVIANRLCYKAYDLQPSSTTVFRSEVLRVVTSRVNEGSGM